VEYLLQRNSNRFASYFAGNLLAGRVIGFDILMLSSFNAIVLNPQVRAIECFFAVVADAFMFRNKKSKGKVRTLLSGIPEGRHRRIRRKNEKILSSSTIERRSASEEAAAEGMYARKGACPAGR